MTSKNSELPVSYDKEQEVSLPTRREKDSLSWHSVRGPAYKKSIRIFNTPRITRRGMRLIYGRGDHFHKLSCGLDMMLRKDGRLFVLFYSPGKRVTYRCYELIGLKLPPLPPTGKLLDDDCVPEILRDLYEEWAVECMQFPDIIS